MATTVGVRIGVAGGGVAVAGAAGAQDVASRITKKKLQTTVHLLQGSVSTSIGSSHSFISESGWDLLNPSAPTRESFIPGFAEACSELTTGFSQSSSMNYFCPSVGSDCLEEKYSIRRSSYRNPDIISDFHYGEHCIFILDIPEFWDAA